MARIYSKPIQKANTTAADSAARAGRPASFPQTNGPSSPGGTKRTVRSSHSLPGPESTYGAHVLRSAHMLATAVLALSVDERQCAQTSCPAASCFARSRSARPPEGLASVVPGGRERRTARPQSGRRLRRGSLQAAGRDPGA